MRITIRDRPAQALTVALVGRDYVRFTTRGRRLYDFLDYTEDGLLGLEKVSSLSSNAA